MPLPNSKAPRLEAESWVNSETDLEEGTRLLDFWNYSCPGCRKMASQLQKLHENHPELEVVGIHNPEFGFEEERENLEKAVRKLGVNYPVAMDSGETHRKYGNRHGAQRALVHEGEVVWTQAGNSGFKRLEKRLAEILGKSEGIEEVEEETPSMVYLGFNKCRGVNEHGVFKGEKEFGKQVDRKTGEVYLEGEWKMEEEFLEAGENAKMFFKFENSSLDAVIDPSGSMKDVEVLVNGEKIVEEEAGEDLRVEDRSYLRISHPDLYSIVSGVEDSAELVLNPEEEVRFYALSM